MTRVPILTEVVLRAWGTDDPRALTALRAENQPGWTFRTKVVEQRARDAGWPVVWMQDARTAATASLRRLEAGNWTPQGLRDRYRKKVAAAEQRRPERVTVTWDGDDPATIFDE